MKKYFTFTDWVELLERLAAEKVKNYFSAAAQKPYPPQLLCGA
jgi:hypothetical protein